MMKVAIISSQLMLLLGITFFYSLEITIQQNFPERIAAQGTCEVELTINKGDVKGFAKLQHIFPAGVDIEAVETSGATFTFSERKMKFIWLALPEEETFTVKYTLTVTDESIREIVLGGTFSYLEENKRMTYDIPPENLFVGEDPEAVEVPKNPYASVYRTLEDQGNNNYKVNIHLQKKNVIGFAKVQDQIPAGAIASPGSEIGSVFTVVNNKVKFVWMNLPEDSVFTVSYNLDLSGSTEQDPKTALSGEFAFIFEGQTQKVAIGFEPTESRPAETKPEEPVESQPVAEVPETPVVTEVPTTEPEPQEEPVSEQPVASNEQPVQEPEPEIIPEEPSTPDPAPVTTPEPDPAPVVTKPEPAPEPVTSVPDPQTGVHFRVQLLAGHNNVDQAYFRKFHQYENTFFLENHEGWFKYTTGHFDQYRSARDERENFRAQYNFPGPFVVAYNQGERITVQEALMITRQQWVK